MARPIASRFVMRTPEEKERIVLEAIERGVGPTAEAHGVDRRLLQRWIAKYRESGIDGLRSRSGKCGSGNRLAGLRNKKGKTREEELELENLRLRIEVERLKKGYRVKGGGRGKEYVTTKGSNTKS